METKEAILYLARRSVKVYLKERRLLKSSDLAKNLPAELLKKRTGTFVSIHTKGGKLRGCIGTFLPTKENIAEEIIHNAVAAATQDPRFPKVAKGELKNIRFSVDILSKPKPLEDLSAHQPDIYGILIQSKSDRRAGLLLPDLDGVDSAQKQVLIACQKAGINHKTELKNCKLHSFTVERYKE